MAFPGNVDDLKARTALYLYLSNGMDAALGRYRKMIVSQSQISSVIEMAAMMLFQSSGKLSAQPAGAFLRGSG